MARKKKRHRVFYKKFLKRRKKMIRGKEGRIEIRKEKKTIKQKNEGKRNKNQ
jgi:hypothetical protein